MLEPRGDNKYIAWMIDFGHSLDGPDWSVASLTAKKDPSTVTKLGPHPVAAEACSRHSYDDALQRIEAIQINQLNELLQTVPSDWQPGATDRAEVSAFLMTRRSGLAMFRKQP